LLAASVAAANGLAPYWSVVALVVATALAGAAWTVLRRFRPEAAAAGDLGPLVVFAHTLDGVSTAVGVDVLGFGERTPLSRVILEFGASLPTAEFVGSGWPFVLVKVALAVVVVLALADSVREGAAEGYAVLALVVAVGLGPAVHNLVLFTVSG
jgi:uncharacterized membrane protein